MKYIVAMWGILLLLRTEGSSQPITAVSNPVYINFNMPELVLDSEIMINDPNNNNILDANEKMQISFWIANRGRYVANRVAVKTYVTDPASGVIGSPIESLGNMAEGEKILIKRLLEGGPNLKSGETTVEFHIMENDSLAEIITHKVNTYSITRKPRLEIIAHDFFSLGGSKTIRPDSEFELRVRLKNTGGGIARQVRFDINHPKHILIQSDLEDMVVEELEPDAVVELSFRFFMGINYKETTIPIRVKVFDINKGSGEVQTLSDALVND